MRMPRPLAFAALALLLPALAAAAGLEQAKSYTGGAASAIINGCDEPTGVGGATFCGLAGHGGARLRVEIHDVTHLTTTGLFFFQDAAGNNHGDGAFCGGATLTVPPGADRIHVFVGNPMSVPFYGVLCPWAGASGLIALRPG